MNTQHNQLRVLPVIGIVLLASSVWASFARAGQVPDLLVASWGTNQILRYDGQTGAFEGVFAEGGDLRRTNFMTMGPAGNLFVSNTPLGSMVPDQVLQYDSTSGSFLGIFASDGLNGPLGLDFGPDGNLYVASQPSAISSGRILKYDGLTGALHSVFVQFPGTLTNAVSLEFGPDGNLYAGIGSGGSSIRINRYDGNTGAFLGTFFEGAYRRFTFGPDQQMYLSVENRVEKYELETGTFLGIFASGGGLTNAEGLSFGPDGNLYVSNISSDSVIRFDGRTGAFIDEFASGGGLDIPTSLVFIPEPSIMAYYLIGLCVVMRKRRNN